MADYVQLKQTYDQFVSYYPGAATMTQSALISIMVEQKMLSEKDAEILRKGGLIFDFENNTQGVDIYKAMGASFSLKTELPAKQYDYVAKKQYHKTFKNLEVDSNGKILMTQFELQTLKRIYPKDKYDILTEQKDGEINFVYIFDKKTKQKIIDIDYKQDLLIYNVYDKFGMTSYQIDKKTQKVSRQLYNDKDYNMHTSVQYDENENILNKGIFNKKSGIQKQISYQNGYPYEENDLAKGTLKNLLLSDIVKDLQDKTNKKALNFDILKRITGDNAGEIYTLYNEETGRNLIDDLGSVRGIDKGAKTKMIRHFEKCMLKNPQSSGKYIAQKLAEDIYGSGSGDLEKHVKMVDKNNILFVLKEWNEIVRNKREEWDKRKVYVPLPLIPLSINVAPLLREFAVPCESLAGAIYGEFGLDGNKAKELVLHLVQAAENCNFQKDSVKLYAEDIKCDIAKNKNDAALLDVDFIRLGERNLCKDIPVSLPDGDVSHEFRQGNTGDCWCIASFISMRAKALGKEYLETVVLKPNKQTGDMTVCLPGFEKEYVITAQEIDDADHLSEGNGNIRAIEIALDRALKEMGYELSKDIGLSSFSQTCIEGGFVENCYTALMGNAHLLSSEQILTEDFNSPRCVYGLETSEVVDNSAEVLNLSEPLVNNHAYAVIKSNRDYIWIQDTSTFKQIKVSDINGENVEMTDNPFSKLKKLPRKELAELVKKGYIDITRGVIPAKQG